jgi:outer membrane protein OmpA-like peptidoglycan-associated protein
MDLIAPRLFERAESRLADARKRYDDGAGDDDIDRRVEEALEALDEAEELESLGRTVLRGALEARIDALEAGAPDFAAKDWESAEKSARDAGRRIENRDRPGSEERAARAESEYREAELNAIRADVLGRTRAARAAALEAKANKLSPLLSAGALAEEAAVAYRHAERLAGLADSISRKRLTVEDVALRAEEQIRRITEALQFEARFSEGAAPVVDDVLVAIQSLYEERTALRGDVRQRAAEIERLDRSVDSLDARLAAVEVREAAVSAELRERQRRERQFREVEAIFAPSEGEVLRSEDRLILRLSGLTFPSGSDEIRPDQFGLLTKVQRVVREFPEARVVVEGHTDSQGNESLNQRLSRRRAIAVREYLLSNIAMSADRITAVGYGESRPVAPNDTEAGRTRNRRIEITLTFDGTR